MIETNRGGGELDYLSIYLSIYFSFHSILIVGFILHILRGLFLREEGSWTICLRVSINLFIIYIEGVVSKGGGEEGSWTIYLSIYVSINLSIIHILRELFTREEGSWTIYLSIYISIYLSIYLSLYSSYINLGGWFVGRWRAGLPLWYTHLQCLATPGN